MGENKPFPSEERHGLCPLWLAGEGGRARGPMRAMCRSLLHVFLESLMLSLTLYRLPWHLLLME